MVFRRRGFQIQAVFDCYQKPHNANTGWPLYLPDVDFGAETLLILLLSDWVTWQDFRCLELERIEHFYRDRSQQVLILHWPASLGQYYHGPLNLCYLNHHSYEILNQLDTRRSEWMPMVKDTPKSQQWQCLMGHTHPHRRRTAAVVRHWPDGILSLGQDIPLPSRPYSQYHPDNNGQNYIDLLDIYSQHRFNIVVETIYDQPAGIITEKTLYALLSCQIPLLIGHRGIVSEAQRLGIDTFDDVLDVSYDLADDDERLNLALDLNRDTILSRHDLSDLIPRLLNQQTWAIDHYRRQMLELLDRKAEQLAARLLV